MDTSLNVIFNTITDTNNNCRKRLRIQLNMDAQTSKQTPDNTVHKFEKRGGVIFAKAKTRKPF